MKESQTIFICLVNGYEISLTDCPLAAEERKGLEVIGKTVVRDEETVDNAIDRVLEENRTTLVDTYGVEPADVERDLKPCDVIIPTSHAHANVEV